jgi:hypothetical protein
MKVSSFAVARPAYYDRNATSSVQAFLATDGPHGQTTRWTTTVAAGKKIVSEAAAFRNLRTTVATVAGVVTSELQLVSGSSTLILISNRQTDNSVVTQYFVTLSAPLTLYTGESLSAVTVDLSTGGVVQYSLNFKGTSFDA